MIENIYSMESLNMYFFLFGNMNLDENQEIRVRELLSAIYLYKIEKIKNDDYSKIQNFLVNIPDMNEFNSIFILDESLAKTYDVLPINHTIMNGSNEYDDYFELVKNCMLNADLNEMEYFLNTLDEISDLCNMVLNNQINKTELYSKKNYIIKKLDYLEPYIGKDYIFMFRTYLIEEENKKFALVFINNFTGIKESNLAYMIKTQFLRRCSESSSLLKTFYNIELSDIEFENLKIKAKQKFKKSIVTFIVIFLLFLMMFKNMFSNLWAQLIESQTYMLFIMFIVALVYFLLRILKLFNILRSSNKNVNGTIGIVTNKEASSSSDGNTYRYYRIYFPKYRERYNINISEFTKYKECGGGVDVTKKSNFITIVKISKIKFIIEND